MKTKYIFSLLLLVLLFVTCQPDEIDVNPEFKLSFIEQGRTNALAGTTYYVKRMGSGEFLTLYDGNKGAEWDSLGSKGVDFKMADSLPITYAKAGKYYLTVVATSSADFGNSFNRKVKTVEVNVVDERNEFTGFTINGVAGKFTADNQIQYSLPDITTNFNFAASFTLNSTSAKVYVNNIEQVSGVTTNDFSPTGSVVYVVKSAQGNEKTYTVKFSTFPASSEKQLTKFQLFANEPKLGYVDSNSELATINEANKTINLAVNYGTKVTAVKFKVESSPLSSVLVNNQAYTETKRYNLNTISSVKVVAQNGSSENYTLSLISQNPILSFTFDGLVPAPAGIIDPVAKTVTINVLSGTDITKLIAKWTGSVGIVKVASVDQVNGVTTNDFTTPKVYSFYKGTTLGDSYTVTVNVK